MEHSSNQIQNNQTLPNDSVSTELAPRPKNIQPGNIPLITNLLGMKVPDLTMFYYSVTIEPSINRKLNQSVVLGALPEMKDLIYGYDNAAMFVTTKKIDDLSLDAKLSRTELKIDINYKNCCTLKDSIGMQCLEILLRSYQAEKYNLEGCKVVTDQSKDSLSGSIEVWFGLSQRVKAFNNSYFLNVDLAHSFYYESISLIQVLEKNNTRRRGDHFDLRQVQPGMFRDLAKFIKTVKLETMHRERNFKFKAADITDTSASDTFFELENKKESVADYFERAYGPLRHRYLPCVVVKKKDSNIFFPLEVVKIVAGQKFSKKISDTQTSELIRKVATPANKRFQDLTYRLNKLEVCDNSTLRSLNVQINSKFYECSGKQLPIPTVNFALNDSARVQRGSWNLANKKVIKGVAIQFWSVFVIADVNLQEVGHGIKNLVKLCNEMGLKMAQPLEIRKTSVNALESNIKSKKLELAMIILQDKSAQVYQDIKKTCDLNAVIVSQCIRKQNIRKFSDPSFCANICLKINTKLGGTNFIVDNDPEMITFGIDVTHPGMGDLSNRSIAAIVSSYDGTQTSFYTSLKMQPTRQDIVDDLKNIVKEHINEFRNKTRKVPKKVVVFRDGIGDSSIMNIYHREMEEFREGFKACNPNYNPKFSFILVQKRHSIRFKDLTVDDRRNTGNPNPGLLVDSLGTKYNDFFMVSHYALQGTPCPIKYHILTDNTEINFPKLIFNMTHTFSRATKSVSVVPPIYYAHLAAARAKAYVVDQDLRNPDDKLRYNLWYL